MTFPMIPYPRLRRRPSDDPYEGDAWAAADEPAAPPVRIPFAGQDPYESTPESEAIVRGREEAGRGRANEAISRLRLPVEAIDAEDTSINSRLRTPNPEFVETYDRTSRTDPQSQRASMLRQGVTADEYDAAHRDIGPGPVRPVRNEHPTRGGFLGTLKNIGKGALLGFSMGGRNGMGQGIGGALAGAIAGGASPKMLENTDYAVRRMPQYQEEADQYNKELGQRELLADRVGNRVGFDPISGLETPEREDRRENRKIRRMQMENLDEDRDLRRSEREKQDRERVAATAVERAALMKQPVPLAAVKGTSLEAWGGQTPPAKTGNIQTVDTDQGVMKLNPDGSVAPLTGPDGRPLTKRDAGAAGRAQSERHWQEGNRRQDQKEAEARQEKANVAVSTFENAKKEAERAAKEYRETLLASQRQQAEGAAKGEHVVSPEKLAELEAKVKSSKEGMLNAHRAVADNFGDQYEVATDRVGNPYVKEKAGTGARGRGSTAAGKVPVMKQSNVAAAAARRGVTPEKFIEDFEAAGGVVTP